MAREIRFGMIFAAVEYEALRQLAEDNGLSKAATIRRLIRLSAKEKGLWPNPQKNT